MNTFDADDDGIPNDVDNCDADPNVEQTDTDNDNVGDACDNDDDGDGFLDGVGVKGGSGCSSVPASGLLLLLPLMRRRRRSQG